MHLARAGDLEPAAVAERHVDLGRRLGEREERRPEADLDVVALEEVAQELGEHALQVGERHVVVDPQPLDLVEHRRVRRVAVDAVHAARRDDLDRRRVRFHVADLDRRGVRAQHHAAFDVERVLHRAGRWFSGVLSAVKLWKSSSISGPSATVKPSERNSASTRSSVRVIGCSVPVPRPRPGSVTSSASPASCASSFASASAPRRALSAASSFTFASLIRAPAAGRSVGRQLAEALQLLGQHAGLAEIARLRVLERGRVAAAAGIRPAPCRRFGSVHPCRDIQAG